MNPISDIYEPLLEYSEGGGDPDLRSRLEDIPHFTEHLESLRFLEVERDAAAYDAEKLRLLISEIEAGKSELVTPLRKELAEADPRSDAPVWRELLTDDIPAEHAEQLDECPYCRRKLRKRTDFLRSKDGVELVGDFLVASYTDSLLEKFERLIRPEPPEFVVSIAKNLSMVQVGDWPQLQIGRRTGSREIGPLTFTPSFSPMSCSGAAVMDDELPELLTLSQELDCLEQGSIEVMCHLDPDDKTQIKLQVNVTHEEERDLVIDVAHDGSSLFAEGMSQNLTKQFKQGWNCHSGAYRLSIQHDGSELWSLVLNLND